jgi:hypothetical protein
VSRTGGRRRGSYSEETLSNERVEETSVGHGPELAAIEEHEAKGSGIERREREEDRELEREMKKKMITHLQRRERIRESIRSRREGHTDEKGGDGSEKQSPDTGEVTKRNILLGVWNILTGNSDALYTNEEPT